MSDGPTKVNGNEEPGTPSLAGSDVEKAPTSQNQPSLAVKPKTDRVDGGFAAISCVIGAFFSMLATFGMMNAFGSFQFYYQENQLHNKSPSDISWIGTVQLFLFFLSGGVIGRLFDTYGPRPLIALGTVVYVFSLMMTSLASKYYQFMLAQGILFGVAVGLLFYPSLSSVNQHFVKYRATAAGITVAGSSVGGVIFPLILGNLFPSVGFGWAVRVSAFVCLAACLIALFTVDSRFPRRKPGKWIDVADFKDIKFLALAAGSGVTCLGVFVPFFYIVQYCESIGISTKLGNDVLAVMNAGSVIGRILPAYIADRFGRFNTFIPCCALSGIFSLAIWLPTHSLLAIMWFAALYGVVSGAFIALNTPCLATISQIEKIGTRIGMYYSLLSFFSLVGGPIAGALLTRDKGSYVGLIIFTGVTQIAGAGILAIVKLMINRDPLAKV